MLSGLFREDIGESRAAIFGVEDPRTSSTIYAAAESDGATSGRRQSTKIGDRNGGGAPTNTTRTLLGISERSPRRTAELGTGNDVRIRGGEVSCKFAESCASFLNQSRLEESGFTKPAWHFSDPGQDDVQYACLHGRRRINRFIVEQRIRE